MRIATATCLGLLLLLLWGCQSTGRSVETSNGGASTPAGWTTDRWGNPTPRFGTQNDTVELAGDPSQQPLEGPDDAAFAAPPEVALPPFEEGGVPTLNGGVLAVATVVDGRLQDGEPPAQLRQLFADLAALVMVRGSDFATHQRLGPSDLCLAARIGRAEHLLICAVDAAGSRWQAWLYEVDSAALLGCVTAVRLVASDASGVPELDAVFSDLALLLADGRR